MKKVLLLLCLSPAFIVQAQTFRVRIADSLQQPALDGRLAFNVIKE
jgi:hypothetical protein